MSPFFFAKDVWANVDLINSKIPEYVPAVDNLEDLWRTRSINFTL